MEKEEQLAKYIVKRRYYNTEDINESLMELTYNELSWKIIREKINKLNYSDVKVIEIYKLSDKY